MGYNKLLSWLPYLKMTDNFYKCDFLVLELGKKKVKSPI